MVKRIGRYEVQAELGRGGFGQVFRAYDPVVGRSVAIKTLNAEGDAELLTRFRNEAGATGKLRHPNIIVVYDFGEQNGAPYLVMELLEGEDLERILASGRRLKMLQSVYIMSQVASGLQHAHVNGIVHRDVKPANIMLLSNGTVKIMDFGIALLTQATEARLTAEGSLVGTFPYMAPEQFYGTASDALTDIFAFGVTFYKLLTGAHPFHAPEMAGVMFNIVNKTPAPLRSLNPECPEVLEEAVLKTLSKDRDARYQTLDDVLFDLEPIVVELRKERTTELIAEGRERLAANEFDEAQAIIRQALEIDPSNRTARELRERLQREIKERNLRPRIAALVDEGREQLRAHQYDQAIQKFESALRLDQSSPEVHALLEETRAAWERAQRSERLTKEAHRAFDAGDLTAAHKGITDALALAPDDQPARELLEDIRVKIEARNRQRYLNEVLSQAKGLILLQNFEESIRLLTSLEPEYPESGELQQLLARAVQERDSLLRTQRLQAAVSDAKELLKDRRFADALQRISSSVEEFPESSELRDLGSYAQEELKSQQQAEAVATVAAEVKELIAAGDLDPAIERIRSALVDYPTASALRELLQSTLSAKSEHERSSALEATLEDVRRRIEAGGFSEALDQIEAFTRAYGEAAVLEPVRRSAEDGLEKQRRIQAIRKLLLEGQGLIDEGRPSTASEVLHQATVDFPGDQNLTRLLDVARGKLQEQRQSEAVGKLVEEAENLARSGRFEDALQTLEAGLQQFPGNNRLARSRDAIQTQRVRQERERLRKEAFKQVNDLKDQRKPGEAETALQELIESFGEDQETADAARSIAETRAELEREEDISRTAKQAQTLLDSGQASVAAQGLREGLARYPKSPELVALLSVAEGQERERQQALSATRHAIVEMHDNGRFDDAMHATRSAIEQFGDEPILTELRAGLEQDLERIRGEEIGHKRRQELVTTHDAIVEMRDAGRLDDAMYATRSALEQFGDEPILTKLQLDLETDLERVRAEGAALERRQALVTAHDSIAAMRDAERLDDAMDATRSAIEQFGEEPILRKLRTELEQELERVRAEKAAQERQQALAAAREAIVGMRDSGRWDETILATRTALAYFGEEPLLTELQTELEQELERARADKAAEEREEPLASIQTTVGDMRSAGRLDEALEVTRSAIQQFGDEPVLTGLHNGVEQELEEARAAKLARDREQQVVQTRSGIAELRNDARLEDALPAAHSAIQQFSEDSALTDLRRELEEELERARRTARLRDTTQQIESLFTQGEIVEAKELVQLAIGEFGNEGELLRLLAQVDRAIAKARQEEEIAHAIDQARAFAEALQFDQAYALLDSAIASYPEANSLLLPTREEIHVRQARLESLALARQLHSSGDLVAASEIVTHALKQAPTDPEWLALKAQIDAGFEKQRRAEEMRSAVQSAEAMRDQGRYKEAATILDAALHGLGSSDEAVALRNRLQAQIHEQEKAEARKRTLGELFAIREQVKTETKARSLKALGLQASRIAQADPQDKEFKSLAFEIQTQIQSSTAAERRIPWKIISAFAAVVVTIGIALFSFLTLRKQPTATLTSFQIRTDPAGATVRLGNRSCVSPACTFELTPGEYQVDASLAGYQDAHQTVRVDKGQRGSLVNLALDPVPSAPLPPAGPKTGSLVVQTSAPRTLVTVDGIPRGRTDQQGALAVSLDAAVHTVQVEKAGYEVLPAQRTTVTGGSSQNLAFNMTLLNGRLELRGAPAGAVVRVNGAQVGTTRGGTFSAPVSPGEQTLEIAQGGASRQIPQIFEPGQTIALDWSNVAPVPAAPAAKPAPSAEQQDWERVRASSNPTDLAGFLNKYPNSPHSIDVSGRLDDLNWRAVNRTDPLALQTFLAQNPSTPHRAEAQTMLDRLQQQKLEAQQKIEPPKFEQPKFEQGKPEPPKVEPPKAAPAQPVVQEGENRAIRATLDQFNTAFQQKSPRDLKRIWPSVPDSTAKAMRLPGTTYRMVLLPVRDPQISNGSASILCELTTTVTLRGQSTDKQRQVQVILQRNGESWSIVNPFGSAN